MAASYPGGAGRHAAAAFPNNALWEDGRHAASGTWRTGPACAVARSSLLSVRVRQLCCNQFGDLGGVEGRALAEVVAADEQLERVGEVERLPQPSDERGVGADDVGGRRELTALGVVDDDDARRLDESDPRVVDGDLALEHGVDRERVRRDDRNPHAGG